MFAKFGLKNTFNLGYVIGLTGMIALLCYQGNEIALLAIFIMGSKFGVAVAFNTVYVGTDALFPISIVATAFGVCNIPSRIFTIAAPEVAELKPTSIAKYAFILMISIALVTNWLFIEKRSDESNDKKKEPDSDVEIKQV